ncbi:sugar phosphate nucleotidyltransferase [Salinispira pacifica]|uniref:D-glycero-D-manno-heptose 1-phosphate guanosyltransferase n=1 Tax=Salinispira pacifica TaxID=1307761 RepID=V5WL84_9SPIO|nr:sugar phosphate nucleotidyltransferase [Salinispira pacifica]AHC16488.1 D-glycero-D-manno-heptose 1-phosphate guanosyltransferase [Salinispira pacifica]
MQEIIVDDLLINKDQSVKTAMRQLDKVASKVLFVVDNDEVLLGSVSDGDIRRFILQNYSIEEPVGGMCNRSCLSIGPVEDLHKAYEQMQARDISFAPRVNANNRVVDIISLPSSHKKVAHRDGDLDLPVVIMAGGKGTRMEPFTNVLPKPLIPIGNGTIMEIIIDGFQEYGISQFYFTLNYRGEMIRAYFDGIDRDYEVNYVWEKEFNGTAASLKLIKDIKRDFIVSNCDIIVKTNYSQVYEFHKESGAMLTVISSIQHEQFPYGVIDFKEGGEVTGLREKPEFSFPINTGVYILSSECFEYIPEGEFFHMTHLIERLIKEGKKVVTFPVNEKDFIDTGQWDEYKTALDRLL